MAEIDDYDYHLPRERIAQEPLRQRSDSRLMVVDRAANTIEHAYVRDLPQYLRRSDVVVLNDTRVIPARLVGRRPATGGRWEGLFLDEESHGMWRILCKARGKMQPGEIVQLLDRSARPALQLELATKLDDGSWVVRPLTGGTPLDLLEQVGRVPLPHYIRHGEMVDADVDRYQTVFADVPGSVAAPTAGLHFTPRLLKELTDQGVDIERVTLHVGVGTFRPVKTDTLADHAMHAEWCRISSETVDHLQRTRRAGGRIVAVGTTSVRTLETAAQSGELQPWTGPTQLFIRPPYTFRAVDALMTNFHLPRSTLLVLVRTFGGDALIRRAYLEAIEYEYRFYSYGDAMLIV